MSEIFDRVMNDRLYLRRRELILDQIGAERYLRRLARGVKSPEDRARIPRLGVSVRGRVREPPQENRPVKRLTSGFDPLPIAPFIITSRDRRGAHTAQVPHVLSVLAASRATMPAAPQVSIRQPPASPESSSSKGQQQFNLSDFKIKSTNTPETAAHVFSSAFHSKGTRKMNASVVVRGKKSQLARMRRHRRRSTRKPINFTGRGKGEIEEEHVELKPVEDKSDEEFWAMMKDNKAKAALTHSTPTLTSNMPEPHISSLAREGFTIGDDIGATDSMKLILLSHAFEH